MLDLTTPLIPYKGTGIFELNANYDDVIAQLQAADIGYTKEVWKDNDVDPPWTVITISKSDSQFEAVKLFFAKDRLWKICLCYDFEGTLPNGIHTGMNFEEALKIDKNLRQDEDWDEVYISPDGYFIEYGNRTLEIIMISVFIPAAESDEFYEYNW